MTDLFKELIGLTPDFSSIRYTLESTAISLVNRQRQNARHEIDYIEFMLPSAMNQIPEHRNLIQQRIMGKSPLSLMELERAFDRIASDKRPRGVILFLRGLALPMADLMTLRDSIKRLRSRGKRVVVYAQEYGLAEYYIASAADEILIQPGGVLNTIGLFRQQTFLKEGLAAIGLKADVVQITPFKGFADTLNRTEPSKEGKEQMNWLLDSQYEIFIQGIAEGRNIEPDAARAFIDNSPMTDKEALAAGHIDGMVNEEKLYEHLGVKHIVLWEQADGMLPLKVPRPTSDYIGLIRAAGLIIPGESARPPVDIPIPFVGGERMGDVTIVRQVRNLMRDDNCKALVLYIDSGGGSGTASEAITSALTELAKEKPLVVYMGNVAASGGYYIATGADHIFAQPGTITGSIGVIMMKLVNNEALQKLKFNPYTYLRGKNAGMFSSLNAFTEDERKKADDFINHFYEQFIGRVADARKMKTKAVDKIGGGRVWTGQQALENGLVDEMGGLYEALMKAREMANVAPDTPIGLLRSTGKPLPAQIAEQADPAAALRYWQENLAFIASGQSLMLMPSLWE